MVEKTISPAFQKTISDNFKAFKTGIKQPSGQAQLVEFMNSGKLNALAEKLPAIDLQYTAVSVFDNKTSHLAGSQKSSSLQAWPDEWVNSLPEHFRNYRAVLWDKLKKTLEVVQQGSFNKTLPKITMHTRAAK